MVVLSDLVLAQKHAPSTAGLTQADEWNMLVLLKQGCHLMLIAASQCLLLKYMVRLKWVGSVGCKV